MRKGKMGLQSLLTPSMMTPIERARGRFLRAPDGHGDGGGKGFTQADIDAAVEKAKEGLEAKNKELLDEVKQIKTELRKSKDIDPADLTRLEEENDRLRGELTKAQKEAKDATTRADKAEKSLEAESGYTSKLLIQDGLKSALIANGVKDEDFIDTLTAKFATGATVAIDGDTRKALIGDKPIADYVKEWAGSDAGKKFVSAPVNSGGGAPGGKAGASGKTITQAQHDAMLPKERAAFFADGGSIAEAA